MRFIIGLIVLSVFVLLLLSIKERMTVPPPKSQKVTLTIYGNTLCSDKSDTCFEVQPNKIYCFDKVCFTKPEPWQ